MMLIGGGLILAAAAKDGVAAGWSTVSVPVKVLSTVAEPQPAMMPGMAVRTIPEPTTPGGKLPQYQLGHLNRTTEDLQTFDDPRLRLLLALPETPLLIEATITIDDQPFLMPREKRVQDLAEFSANPVKYRNARVTLKEQAGTLLDAVKSTVLEAVEKKAAEAVEQSGEAAEPKADVAEAEDAGDAEQDAVPEVAAVPEYETPASVYDRIERYIESTGEGMSASEVRWLLTNWIDGPVVLLLNDNYQRFRADQTPVFKILDRDRDRMVSAKELDLAVSSFQECDLNLDEIVQYTELAEAAKDARDRATHSGHGKLIFSMPTAATARGTYARMADRYRKSEEEVAVVPRFDTNADGKFDAQELKQLNKRVPDVKLTIHFQASNPDKANLEVTDVDPQFHSATHPPVTNENSVTLYLAGTKVSFGAIQNAASDQISVGAVDDGYPMLPVVDPNDDGRFTIRELRELKQRLTSFDADKDGTLTLAEAQSTLRVSFGLGPLVHAELSGIRDITGSRAVPSKPGPDWFARMDRNKDGDLTRKEFVGTDEQFAKLDGDTDKLISVQEAEEVKSE